MLRFAELLNKVWGLEGCSPFLPLRKNRSVRFGFSGCTVLVGGTGYEVSFNTTVRGVWCCPFKGHSFNLQVLAAV